MNLTVYFCEGSDGTSAFTWATSPEDAVDRYLSHCYPEELTGQTEFSTNPNDWKEWTDKDKVYCGYWN